MARLLLLAVLLLSFSAAHAQTSTRDTAKATITPIQQPSLTVARTAVPPQIDGHVNDDEWAAAPVVDQFWQRDPDEGQPGSERTEARMLYDDNALYIGFILYDSEPDKIRRRLSRRDRDVPSDKVQVLLDSYNDDRTAFNFIANASGVKIDALVQDDGNNMDMNWDGLWDVEVAERPDGWSAEFRIPFSTLRFDPDQTEWGLNLGRIISRKSEYQYWSHVPKGGGGWVSRFGAMEGLRGLQPPRSLLVTPYGLAGGTRYPSSDFSGRLDQYSPEYRAGVDVQYGLSSNSTLNLTVNPDFGQVELDEVVLNLSAFETFFPEKRPFFLEGTDIFNTVGALGDDGPASYLFYSRRIGRQPASFYGWPGEATGGDWLVDDNPSSTPILAAAKLSGKTDTGWSYGLLNATTQKTEMWLENAVTGDRLSMMTEPMTNYSVARLQRALPGAASYLGVIGTSTLRDGEGLTNAYSGGMDWRFNTNDYKFTTEGIVSTTQRDLADGSWQRGYQVQARVGSFGHRNFLVQGGGTYTSPDFNPNDLGFNTGRNSMIGFVWGQYRDLDPNKVYRSFRYNLSLWNVNTVEPRKLQENGLSTNVHFQWANYWMTGLGVNANTSGFDPYEARRRGTFFRSPQRYSTWLWSSTDQRNDVVVSINAGNGADEYGGSHWRFGTNLSLKVGSATQLDVSPSYNRRIAQTGWVANVNGLETPGETTTVFGERDVDQVNLTLRGLHSFSRDITLQGYVQYFWARGAYDRFQALADDGSLTDLSQPYDKDTYRNPDFNQSAFNVNLIGRWEYRPGSTVFLVWTHARSAYLNNTVMDFGGFAEHTFDTPSTNVLLLKWTYAVAL